MGVYSRPFYDAMSTHEIMHEVTEIPWPEYVFIVVNLMQQSLITLAAHLLCCMTLCIS